MPAENATKPLFTSECVRAFDFHCACRDTGLGAEERSSAHAIAFPRRGLFVRHQGRRAIVADSNQVLFFNAHEPYRVSHPIGGGDRCTVLEFSAAALTDVLGELDPRAADRPERPFRIGSTASDATLHWAQRAVLSACERECRPRARCRSGPRSETCGTGIQPGPRRAEGPVADELAMEEFLLQLAHRALRGAYAHRAERLPHRLETTHAHRSLADDVQTVLAQRFSEKLRLGDVARTVHSSPFHLSRVFRRATGSPIHRYLNRLRLRACLERLADGCSDLTSLALDCGFHSHAHFTDAFRMEFGTTPSKARASLCCPRSASAALPDRVAPPDPGAG